MVYIAGLLADVGRALAETRGPLAYTGGHLADVGRDVARRVQQVPMHPRGSAPPPPEDLLPAYDEVPYSKFSWDIYEASCSQLSSFEASGAPNHDTSPAGAPWSELGAQIKSQWAPLKTTGPTGTPYDRTPLA